MTEACNIKKVTDSPEPPFVIRCLSEQCTVVHAGINRFTASQIDDEIARGTEFGKKLKQARDEVAAL